MSLQTLVLRGLVDEKESAEEGVTNEAGKNWESQKSGVLGRKN